VTQFIIQLVYCEMLSILNIAFSILFFLKLFVFMLRKKTKPLIVCYMISSYLLNMTGHTHTHTHTHAHTHGVSALRASSG